MTIGRIFGFAFSALFLAGAGLAQLPAHALEGKAPSAAATERAATPDKGTRLILLGTGGGPIVHLARSQSASLIVVDGRNYLIDCGDGTVWKMKQAGFLPTSTDKVFLSHLHFDHVAGVASLLGFNWASGDRRTIDFFGPPGTSELLTGAFSYLQIPEALYSVQLPPHKGISEITIAHDIVAGAEPVLVYQDDKVKVTAIENSHYSRMHMPDGAAGGTRSYSYRFETPDRTIVFTGDTGPSAALEKFARGADILVSEVIDLDTVMAYMRRSFQSTDEQMKLLVEHQEKEHLTPEEVGKLATAAGAGMVVLSHIAPSDDVAFDSLRYTRGVRAHYSGVVVSGRDLDQF